MDENDVGELEWARWPWQRCKAVKEPNPGGLWGRCDRKKNHGSEDHALERGFVVVYWSTRWTNMYDNPDML